MHFGVANWELPFGLSRVRHLIKSFPIHVVSVLRVKNKRFGSSLSVIFVLGACRSMQPCQWPTRREVVDFLFKKMGSKGYEP